MHYWAQLFVWLSYISTLRVPGENCSRDSKFDIYIFITLSKHFIRVNVLLLFYFTLIMCVILLRSYVRHQHHVTCI